MYAYTRYEYMASRVGFQAGEAYLPRLCSEWGCRLLPWDKHPGDVAP